MGRTNTDLPKYTFIFLHFYFKPIQFKMQIVNHVNS
jgi:hypothetical protein